MNRPRTVTALLVMAIGSLAPHAALACRCQEPSVASALGRAEAAVLGRVTAVRAGETRTVFSVDVSRSWKRALGSQVEVETGTTCALPAKAGQTYLLFLKRNPNGRLYTRRCMGDRADPTPELLSQLGVPARPAP